MWKKLGDLQRPVRDFDNTALSGYATCPRYAFYQTACGLRSRVEPLYFLAGRAWHKALATFYTTEEASIEERLLAGQAEIYKLFTGIETNHAYRNAPNLASLLEHYVNAYGEADLQRWSDVKIEVGWRLPFGLIDGEEVDICGAIDGLLVDKSFGKILLENKQTASYISDWSLAQFASSTQVTNYIWAGSQVLEGLAGMLVNYSCIRVPKTSRGDVTKLFARDFQTREKAFLVEHEEWIIDIVKRWLKSEQTGKWPMYFHFCNGGYGLTTCDYWQLCSANMGVEPQEILVNDEDFARQEWKPWERDGDEGA